MFNIFGKKKSKKNEIRKEIKPVDIPKTEEKVEKTNIFEMKYRNNNTGEIHTFDASDFEAFDEVMSRKDVTLIFG